MKIAVAAAIAAALSLQTAFADTAAKQVLLYRSATPLTFTAEDLARFESDAATSAAVDQAQRAGHRVRALTPEELEVYKAGQVNSTWIVIGVLAAVVIVVAASGGGGDGYGGGGGGGGGY